MSSPLGFYTRELTFQLDQFSGGRSERCEKALAETYRKIRKKDKDSDISRRLVELGIAGLVTEKEAKEAVALASLPKDICQDLLDDKITLAEAKRQARRETAKEEVGRRRVRP